MVDQHFGKVKMSVQFTPWAPVNIVKKECNMSFYLFIAESHFTDKVKDYLKEDSSVRYFKIRPGDTTNLLLPSVSVQYSEGGSHWSGISVSPLTYRLDAPMRSNGATFHEYNKNYNFCGYRCTMFKMTDDWGHVIMFIVDNSLPEQIQQLKDGVRKLYGVEVD